MTSYDPLAIPQMDDAASSFGFSPCEGGVCAAAGMKAAGISAGFRKNPERLDMALVAADKPCTVAATFTQNRFCAAPVQVSRKRAASGHARAVVLNSGNANAATGEPGIKCALDATSLVAQTLGCSADDVLVASTGVIGVQLPFEPYVGGVPAIVAALDHSAAAAHDAACAVMTTDTHPKEVSLEGPAPQSDGTSVTVHVGGFVKGSGMIQPNMATMLCVLSTDAPLTAKAAHSALLAAVKQSFNKVTVDSDTSTNDSCFLFATGEAGGEKIDEASPAYPAIAAAIKAATTNLARQIAADGEGSTKLVTVDVLGAASQDDADTVAFAIANSPLVKTAIYGHDANWGRVAAAAGKCGVEFDQSCVDIDFMGVPVLRGGLPVGMDEDDMLRRFEAPEINVAISLGQGDAHSRVWTCDLTHDYVKINGEYRT
ncbi:MAG: bifunctional glutamate N-acetyltransferase/amino-acid acetyltransferase ArgJ [Tractidigestivibacter sp.]|jgi:glutamate N-acetyltransferase/amino-acid N-acetyltransferase|uniref:bifunctional glutamate N-acetyltransferase/amino-acid acetyltransferase ArgJ n=1 Tax=Tractidigestivibacter sp. TaxID=2847320 RepID=UPI003D8D634D